MSAIIFKVDSQYDVGQTTTPNGSRLLNEVIDPSDSWYERARVYRTDPTISLARAILSAPIIENPWSVGGSDPQAIELIKKVLLPHRKALTRTAILSCIDYGWQSWEVRPYSPPNDPLTKHIKFKPLKHDVTRIVVDGAGFPTGVINSPSQHQSGKYYDVHVESPNVVFCAGAEEYGNPLGYPILKNCEKIIQSYEEVEAGAIRYVNRIAGAHWVLWYPSGTTVFVDGEEVSSDVVADKVLQSLKSSGRVALPVSNAELQQLLSSSSNSADVKKSGWDIKLISETGGLDPFLDRQSYLDALKMRALFVPERTALEGHFGTKADSSEHADIAMMAIASWGNAVLDWFNSPYGFVASVLAFNGIDYYPGRVQIEPLPFQDDERTFFREIFRTVINNVGQFASIIDMETLGPKTGIPIDTGIWNKLRESEIENAQTRPTTTPDGSTGKPSNPVDKKENSKSQNNGGSH